MEVPVETEVIPFARLSEPETFNAFANVEDAATIIELDAESIPFNSRFEEKVEEAVEESPPVKERRVLVAELELTCVKAS